MNSGKQFDFGALLRDHSKDHKARPAQFVSVASGLQKRLQNKLKSRRSTRFNFFDSTRNLPKSEVKQEDQLTKLEHRKQRLEKWKEERNKKKLEAAAQKKKPFVTGVPHAPLKYVPPPPLKPMPSSSGRVTRSQTNKQVAPSAKENVKQKKPAKSFAPKNATFKAPEIKNMVTVPTLHQSKSKKNKELLTFEPLVPNGSTQTVASKEHQRKTRAKTKVGAKNTNESSKNSTTSSSRSEDSSSNVILKPMLEKSPPKKKTPKKNVRPTKSVTPKNPIPKSESSSEERLKSPKNLLEEGVLTPKQIVDYVKQISPCVTLSRGKENARREMKKKLDEGLLDYDISDIDSVEHFRRQMDSEIKRLTELCDTWEKMLQQIAMPEAVQDCVRGATGQARLLMSSKMQQFASLVARCERPEPGHALVTPADLHGFWDMVFMQVENVNMRFKKLDEMQARNWKDEAPVVPQKKTTLRTNKPRAATKPAATSRLRDMIAAARKAKKEESGAPEGSEGVEGQLEANKTFDAGFFRVQSPIRVSNPVTPSTPRNNSSLLKVVLSNEANNSVAKNSASFAMLRASIMGKNLEDSPLAEPLVLTPINLNATPGRSILKPKNVSTAKKSIKVVLFNDSDSEDSRTFQNEPSFDEVSGIQVLEDAITDLMMDDKTNKKQIKDKENKDSKKSLVKQDAVDERSPVMTRSRRKSMTTPAKNTSIELSDNKTPKRVSRR